VNLKNNFENKAHQKRGKHGFSDILAYPLQNKILLLLLEFKELWLIFRK